MIAPHPHPRHVAPSGDVAREPAAASARRLRIALAHDWLVGMRGGERVLEAIAATLSVDHDISALYTMFDDGRPLSPHLDRIPRRISALGQLPGGLRARRWLLPLYPWAVGQVSRRLARDHARAPVDLLISTSSAAIKGLRAPAGVPHLCYCHTPARYLWSQGEQYAGGLRGLGLAVFGASLRAWDARTSAHVTAFLANSTHTRDEIARCYQRPSDVLFPPVRTDFFTPDRERWTGEAPAWLREAGLAQGCSFWLAAGALEPYKRFDQAILAARLLGQPLVIVGTGSDERRLRSLHAGAAVFLGRVSDERLRDLYRAARLLIFPQIEDFGIVAAEAQACGCPVLARRAGGVLDSVIDGVTGAHFDWTPPDHGPRPSPHPEALPTATDAPLVAAVARVPERTPETSGACRANAERFGQITFSHGLRRAVANLVPGPDRRAATPPPAKG